VVRSKRDTLNAGALKSQVPGRPLRVKLCCGT